MVTSWHSFTACYESVVLYKPDTKSWGGALVEVVFISNMKTRRLCSGFTHCEVSQKTVSHYKSYVDLAFQGQICAPQLLHIIWCVPSVVVEFGG